MVEGWAVRADHNSPTVSRTGDARPDLIVVSLRGLNEQRMAARAIERGVNIVEVD